MDYRHELDFGTFLSPQAKGAERVVELAQLTEDVGLDLVTVQDHPYQAKFLDTWTLLAFIGARTRQLRIAPNVANLPLRPPVVLARSVASLDILTGGRVELGLGAGGFFDAIAAIGGPRHNAGSAVDALEEGISIIRAIWAGQAPIRIEGQHYRVWGAHPGPTPAHDVGIWVGSYKRRMLELTGRLGDGWLPSSRYAAPEELGAMSVVIDDAARAAGRDPGSIRRLYNISGSFRGSGSGFLDGPPPIWAEQLAELTVTHGMCGFILMTDDPDDIRRFAGEVAPDVVERVAAERSGQGNGYQSEQEPISAAAEQQMIRSTMVGPSADRASGGAPLGVAPTPDPGVRLSNQRLWDESTRPSGRPADPDRLYTADQQAAGRHLVDIHDHLRTELAQIRDIVSEVIAGNLGAGAARSEINTMTMRQNNWTAGVYCAQYCRVVTTHHSLEDSSVFPHLRRSDRALGPVIDRLTEEHRVIHDVLEGVDRALIAFVSADDGPEQLQSALDLLQDTLLSHLAYEERELVEPLARLGFY